MPDYEVELTIYDPQNPRPDPLGSGQPMPDTPILVLVTAGSMEEAEDKAVAHVASQSHPPVEWERFDWTDSDPGNPDPNATIERVTWFDPAREDHQIWLDGNAELPPGDEPAEAWKPIYDIRDVKHPFVRPNQLAARQHAAMDRLFTKLAERNPMVRETLARAREAGERLAESLERYPPPKPPKPN